MDIPEKVQRQIKRVGKTWFALQITDVLICHGQIHGRHIEASFPIDRFAQATPSE